MPSQRETDTLARFDRAIEDNYADRVELGRLADEIQTADVDEFDRGVLLGRINQYVVDMDKSDEMTEEVQRGEDLG